VNNTYPIPIRRRTLAGTIRYLADQVCAAVPDDARRLGLSLALEQAAQRAESDARQAEIHWREAADRERALALVQVVRAELDRLERLLPDPDGAGALYAQGGAWVIAQLRAALEPDQAAPPAATLNGTR
jgi:hypothetical protein